MFHVAGVALLLSLLVPNLFFLVLVRQGRHRHTEPRMRSPAVVVHEHRGEPDGLVVCHLPFGPTAYFGIHHAVTRHDIGSKAEVGTVSEAFPHLVFEGLTSKLGQRVTNILKHLFPVPKDESKRVISFINQDDYISFRHHTYSMPKGAKSLALTEVGPRFELKLYQIRLGTMDQQHAELEWVVRSFTRSAKKAKLSEPPK